MDENDSLSEYNKIPLGHNRTNGSVYMLYYHCAVTSKSGTAPQSSICSAIKRDEYFFGVPMLSTPHYVRNNEKRSVDKPGYVHNLLYTSWC